MVCSRTKLHKPRLHQLGAEKINYHPQRRWLEKIVLKGTIRFAVVT